MKVTHLKHEIEVHPGTASSGETAFIKLDGELCVFLGGLAEAKWFLRERKAGPHYGPRAVSWHTTLDSGCCASYHNEAAARRDVAYFRLCDRKVVLSYTEHCPYPGCDGYGDVVERRLRGCTRTRPCPQHSEPVECVVSDTGSCEPAVTIVESAFDVSQV